MPNPVVHFEIGSSNAPRSKEFFTQLFDWKMEVRHGAEMIDCGAIPGVPGINGHLNALGHEPHHYITFYVQVDDVDASLKKANMLGGKTLVPNTDIGFANFAWIGDPDGNIIGLYQPKAKES